MPKERNIVAVIVYDRFDNMKRWIECWEQCDQSLAELVIIHNYKTVEDSLKYGNYCREHGIKYVLRENIGFDIGAFQDVCRERLGGFPNDWNNLLWVTDDTIPMRKDFANVFFDALKETGVGLSCMHISKEVTLHIRTTGFCISKRVSRKLAFPANPIKTKSECYSFEHRGGEKTLYKQIKRMGLNPVQVTDLKISPLWDIGNHVFLKLNRMAEHNHVFSSVTRTHVDPTKVTFICPIFNSFPEIIPSLINQTHKNWELLLIHDGPNETNLEQLIKAIGDNRIKYSETPYRSGNWGHKIRSEALSNLKESNTNYVVITNPDNHHVPVYIEYMMNGFKKNPNAVATYCSKMVHSYRAWDSQDCRIERGWVDCAGVMVKKDIACDVGWNNITDHSADWLYFADIVKKYGTNRFAKVPGCLLVHN